MLLTAAFLLIASPWKTAPKKRCLHWWTSTSCRGQTCRGRWLLFLKIFVEESHLLKWCWPQIRACFLRQESLVNCWWGGLGQSDIRVERVSSQHCYTVEQIGLSASEWPLNMVLKGLFQLALQMSGEVLEGALLGQNTKTCYRTGTEEVFERVETHSNRAGEGMEWHGWEEQPLM